MSSSSLAPINSPFLLFLDPFFDSQGKITCVTFPSTARDYPWRRSGVLNLLTSFKQNPLRHGNDKSVKVPPECAVFMQEIEFKS